MNEGVSVVMDGGAYTIPLVNGGEAWVEHDHGDLFDIGAEERDGRWAYTKLTRAELKEFRRQIKKALA